MSSEEKHLIVLQVKTEVDDSASYCLLLFLPLL